MVYINVGTTVEPGFKENSVDYRGQVLYQAVAKRFNDSYLFNFKQENFLNNKTHRNLKYLYKKSVTFNFFEIVCLYPVFIFLSKPCL